MTGRERIPICLASKISDFISINNILHAFVMVYYEKWKTFDIDKIKESLCNRQINKTEPYNRPVQIKGNHDANYRTAKEAAERSELSQCRKHRTIPAYPAAVLFEIRENEILALSGRCVRGTAAGSVFCGLYDGAVPAGPDCARGVGKPHYDSGFEKRQDAGGI